MREGSKADGNESAEPPFMSGHENVIRLRQSPVRFIKNSPSESQNNLDEKTSGSFVNLGGRLGNSGQKHYKTRTGGDNKYSLIINQPVGLCRGALFQDHKGEDLLSPCR